MRFTDGLNATKGFNGYEKFKRIIREEDFFKNLHARSLHIVRKEKYVSNSKFFWRKSVLKLFVWTLLITSFIDEELSAISVCCKND